MNDLFKKTLLAGVGAAIATKEKAQVAIDELVRQGKAGAADARTRATKIAEDGRKEFASLSEEYGGQIKQTLSRATTQAKEQLATLEARLQDIEKKATPKPAAQPAPQAASKPAPKAAPKHVAKRATKASPKAAAKRAVKRVAKSVLKAASKPASKRAAKSSSARKHPVKKRK